MRRFPIMDPAPGDPKISRRAAFLMLLVAVAVLGVMTSLLLVFTVSIPQMAELERYRPDTTTELYDIHGKIFGSFALERRIVVPYSEFPPVLRQAIFSIEDKNFETNGGVNFVRVIGAAYADLHSDKRAQGASTITMQLTRNLFLSTEKTYGRKLQEIFLALQIERHFTKQQIFTLYANQIYLGRGTYGFEAGSEYYFSKHARDLTLARGRAARRASERPGRILARPAPGPRSAAPQPRPAGDAERSQDLAAAGRGRDGRAARICILSRPPTRRPRTSSKRSAVSLSASTASTRCTAPGCASTPRSISTCSAPREKAVLDNVATYERRHGWKGNLENVLREGQDLATYKHPDWTQPIAEGAYFHALVTEVSPTKMTVRIGSQNATMTYPDWAWTGRARASELAKPGDIVYVKVTQRHSIRHAARHPRAGQRRAGLAHGRRQRQRRGARHGRRPRLRTLAVQPRNPGRAPGRLLVQDLRLHRCDGSRHEAVRYRARHADDILHRRADPTRRTITSAANGLAP